MNESTLGHPVWAQVRKLGMYMVRRYTREQGDGWWGKPQIEKCGSRMLYTAPMTAGT